MFWFLHSETRCPQGSAVHSSAKSFVLKIKRTTKTELVHFSFQFYSHSHRFLDENTTAMYDACSSTVLGIASPPHLISLLASALSWNYNHKPILFSTSLWYTVISNGCITRVHIKWSVMVECDWGLIQHTPISMPCLTNDKRCSTTRNS